MSLKSFFGERKGSSKETEESTTSKKKKKALTRQYKESYLICGLIATGDSHIPSPLCIMDVGRLSNEAMKPS